MATFRVTTSLHNCTSNAPATINSGEDLIFTVTPDSGFSLETAVISVRVGGVLTGEWGFDYNTGVFQIDQDYIYGDISISIVIFYRGYKITWDLRNCSGAEPPNWDGEGDIDQTITANPKYVLPNEITVVIGGNTLSDADYTWDTVTGQLTIPASLINGNVSITIIAVRATSYPVTITTVNCSVNVPSPTTADPDEDFNLFVTANDGYNLKDAFVSVRVGGVVQPASAYNFDLTTGEFNLWSDAIVGPIQLDFSIWFNGHKVTVRYYNCTGDVPEGANDGDTIFGDVKAKDGFLLPTDIDVIDANGEPWGDPGMSWVWDYAADRLTAKLTLYEVDTDLNVTIRAVKKGIKITQNLVNCTSNIPDTAQGGTDIAGKIIANQGFQLPELIIVQVNKQSLTRGVGFEWVKTTGELVIYGDYVTGDVFIEIKAVAKKNITVTKIFRWLQSTIRDVVPIANDVTGFILPLAGYDFPQEIEVKIGNEVITTYNYSPDDGAFFLSAKYVLDNITIIADGVPTTFTVTQDLTGCTSTIPNTAQCNVALTGTISPATSFVLPDDISVTVNGNNVPAIWDNITGAFILPAQYVNGEITISVKAKQKLTVYSISPHTYAQILDKDPLTVRVRSTAGFAMGPNIRVTVDGLTYKDYTLTAPNPNTKLIVFPSLTHGDVVIKVVPNYPTSSIFYENSAESNRVNKTDFLSEQGRGDIIAHWENSTTDPIIMITDNIPDFNYIYYKELGKYFYVERIETVRKGLRKAYLHCDVLMSYIRDVVRAPIMATRREKGYDPYMIDTLAPITSEVSITTQKIPGSPFDYQETEQSNNYVLTSISR